MAADDHVSCEGYVRPQDVHASDGKRGDNAISDCAEFGKCGEVRVFSRYGREKIWSLVSAPRRNSFCAAVCHGTESSDLRLRAGTGRIPWFGGARGEDLPVSRAFFGAGGWANHCCS